MKKNTVHSIFILSLMTVVLLLQISCKEEGPKVYEDAVVSLTPMNLSLSSLSLHFSTYERSTQSVDVMSTDLEWEFVDIPDWLVINPSSGKGDTKVQVTCAKNPNAIDRVGVVTFRSKGSDWNYSTILNVTQVRSVYSVIPEKDDIRIPWTASQVVVKVDSNTDAWTVSVGQGIESWCSVRKIDGGIEINCTENSSTLERSGRVFISTSEKIYTLTIVQEAINYSVKSDSAALNFSDREGTANIYVETYSSVRWTASASEDWISVSPETGKGNATICVTVSENETDETRSGYVTVSTQYEQTSISVNQTGKHFNVSSPSLAFGYKGGQTQITLQTNRSWTATTDCNWIELSQTSGDKDCNITVSVSANNTVVDRKGHVTIAPKQSNPVVFEIEQKGLNLTLSDSTVIFWFGDTTKTITVEADADYRIYTESTWFDVIKGTDKLTLELLKSNSDESLIDSVTLTLSDQEGGTIVRKLIVRLYGKDDSCVDLGLSVRWAVFNMGASNSEEPGDLYAWGATEPYKDKDYSWSSYKFSKRTDKTLTKYCNNSSYGYHGYTDDKTRLDPGDDAASVHWGDEWHIPTSGEFAELLNPDNCGWLKLTRNGISGYLVTSKIPGYEGNSIFLPAAGYKDGSTLKNDVAYCYYWTGDVYKENYSCAQTFSTYNNEIKEYFQYRSYGLSIRPVRILDDSDIKSIYLDCDKLSLIPSENKKIKAIVVKNDANQTTFTDVAAQWSSSDNSVAIVNNGTIIATGYGKCTITAKLGSKRASCELIVENPDELEHDWVDMGLSVKWAKTNIGAITPEGYGDYYAWGDTSTYYSLGQAQAESPSWKEGKSGGYSWSSYFDTDDNGSSFIKYNSNSGKAILDMENDVAYARWGGGWRIPTSSEFEELLNRNNTNSSWTTQDGVNGILITSKIPGYENSTIFLSAAGFRSDNILSDKGAGCYYWSSSLYGDSKSESAFRIYMTRNNKASGEASRRNGMSIRPVRPFEAKDFKSIEADVCNVSLIVGELYSISVSGRKPDNKTVALSRDSLKWSSGDKTVVTVVNGMVTAVGEGSCTITATFDTLSAICVVDVVDPEKVAKEYVDLGLSVLWATYNVGAIRPEMYGDFYSWAETSTYYEGVQAQSESPSWKTGKSGGYSWSSYYDTNDGGSTFIKYNISGGKKEIDSLNDVAHAKWGGDWRIPTDAEMDELKNDTNCVWTWTTENGIYGYKVTSKKKGYENRSIFLPAAGYRVGLQVQSVGSKGYYWSGSLYDTQSYSSHAYELVFSSGGVAVNYSERYHGYSVRPVCAFNSGKLLKGIELNRFNFKLAPGGMLELVATGVKPDNMRVQVSKDSVKWESSDNSVATVTDGIVTAVNAGICTITASLGDHTANCVITVPDISSIVPESVDMGLSVKWATFNVGAYSPEMYGDYYAWGEVETKSSYTWTNYKFRLNGDSEDNVTLKKYNTGSLHGQIDNITTLDPEDDVAHVEWGGSWRMPTMAELNELQDNCNWVMTAMNGVPGYRITSKKTGYTDKSIFLPYAGYYEESSYLSVGECCRYWSSSLDPDKPVRAGRLAFGTPSVNWYSGRRSVGLSVRPVSEYDVSDFDRIELNINNEILVPDESLELTATVYKVDGNTFAYGVLDWSSSNESVATVVDGSVTAIGIGTCTITVAMDTLFAKCDITVIDPNNVTPESVDLGLSVDWATFNVGATNEYDHGGLYAWGELTEKDSYNGWATYKWCEGTKTSFTKYNSYSDYGYVDNKLILEPDDDVAHVLWGDDWRMPTRDELDELVYNCRWEWADLGDIDGYYVTSCIPGHTEQTIFIPASGSDWGAGPRRNRHDAFYRSAEMEVNCSPDKIYYLYFNQRTYGAAEGNEKYMGSPVRAVKKNSRAQNVSIVLSRTALCIEEGSEETISATVKQNYGVLNNSVQWTSSNNNVATVNASGQIEAISPGTCIITAESGGAHAECKVSVISSSVVPQMVDLGLSVNWASFNLGAESPEQTGDYFAWGETKEKAIYNRYTYAFSVGVFSYLTSKYCDNADWGIVDNKKILEPGDDAATAAWGGNWRTPTVDELNDLFSNTTWVWTTLNGVNGFRVTSKIPGYTDRSIFLPAAGVCGANRQMGEGISGHYWTSSTSDAGYNSAWQLFFDYGAVRGFGGNRFEGYTIRPVCDK